MLNGCGSSSNNYNIDCYEVPHQHDEPHFDPGAGSCCGHPAAMPAAPATAAASSVRPPQQAMPTDTAAAAGLMANSMAAKAFAMANRTVPPQQPASSGPTIQPPQQPTSSSTSQQPQPLSQNQTPSQAQEVQLYNKVSTELNSAGTDKNTLKNDAVNLAIAASANNDADLGNVAQNIAASLGNGSFGQQASSQALAAVFPGNDWGEAPATTNRYAPSVGGAFLNLVGDLRGTAADPDTDPNTLSSDANVLKQVAAQAGNGGLAAAAANIETSLQDGTYNQLASLQALDSYAPSSADLSNNVPEATS